MITHSLAQLLPALSPVLSQTSLLACLWLFCGTSMELKVTAEGTVHRSLQSGRALPGRVLPIYCSLAFSSLFVALAHVLFTSAVCVLMFLDPGTVLNEWGQQLPKGIGWCLVVSSVMSRDVAELLTLFKSNLSTRCSFVSLWKPLMSLAAMCVWSITAQSFDITLFSCHCEFLQLL